MAILPFTIEVPQGQPFTIYAEPDNINYFLNGQLDPDTTGGPTNSSASVSAYSRRSYPGDATPVNVSGSTREFLVDPSRKSGNGLPGVSFILENLVPSQEDPAVKVVDERRQFTLKGRVIDLHAFLSAEAKYDTYLHMNTGARYTIPAVVAP